GIRAVGFGLSVSAGNVGPIWPASLCPQNSRSWEPLSTWMRLGGKKGHLFPVFVHRRGLIRSIMVRGALISLVEAGPAVRTGATTLLAHRARPPRQCRGGGDPQARP